MLTSKFFAYKAPQLDYAIERGLSDIDVPLTSDLDIVVRKNDFLPLLSSLNAAGYLVSMTLSYGGARLFIANNEHDIKRIDCMWRCHYWGIPICNVNDLLDSKIVDRDTGLYVLHESAQAKVINAVKNARGGAKKYAELLENYGYCVMSPVNRFFWLASLAVTQPLTSFLGLCRSVLTYSLRAVFPSGMTTYGISCEDLQTSPVLQYLFQNRICKARMIPGFFRSRLLSEFCVLESRALADIDLSDTPNLKVAEKAVLNFLHARRAQIPWPLASLV